ncbi:hypothetical protein HBI56_188370 [Parastagonospora nodorum]|uniref:BTB domain-containing protein n=1 Tax=Phaeosphaeria nodorum (strain SN15 / ATCC MYA-4574 / FGSC 10173) TaxID=321614 RepID=A0A7U2FBQ5_PHANO|nr:hypothetical protein HBH56_146120 [Parastagonospora nodorum]QRD01284.1 hypothetical protein JI435_119640 [Parastagonospora nodorum SN15]KAH3927732.1 hypothetical protein HBH54_151310 [Parastagonospora nodorum]KAH3970872.1 hypothetical protein HBH52_160180 [Parastagonospora nodorum]KAH3998011.1 hypothetical protein HBI10_134940 [Parastagonospora nodorum]
MTSTTKDVRVPRSSAASYVTTPIIRVIVGEAELPREFFVHKRLICARSEFFKNAMKEPWKEAEEHKVTLSEAEPDIFALYLELLYTDLLYTKEPIGPSDEYDQLCKVYVLAEMLMDDQTKDFLLAAVRAKSEERDADGTGFTSGSPCAQIIYDGTPKGGPLRDLTVKLFTDNSIDDPFRFHDEELPKDFLKELSLSMMTNRPLLSSFNSLQALLAQKEKDHVTLIVCKEEIIRGLKDRVRTLEDNLRSSKLKRRSSRRDIGRSSRVDVHVDR